jgi:hypothetical protein
MPEPYSRYNKTIAQSVFTDDNCAPPHEKNSALTSGSLLSQSSG